MLPVLVFLLAASCVSAQPATSYTFDISHVQACTALTPCNFSTSFLWIPQGLPGESDTVLINSSQSVDFIVPAQRTLILSKLSLVGSVRLAVAGVFGGLTFPAGELVVCDTSIVEVNTNGTLNPYKISFFDSTALVVDPKGTALLGNVTFGGAAVNISLSGTINFYIINGAIQYFTAIGNPTLSILLDPLKVQTAILGDAVVKGPLEIISSGTFFQNSGTLIITGPTEFVGCPSEMLFLQFNGSPVILNDYNCSLGNILLGSDSITFSLYGDQVQIESITALETSRSLLLQATQITNTLKVGSAQWPFKLQFNGNFILNAGSDNGTFSAGFLEVNNGTLQVNAAQLTMTNSSHFGSNISLTIPTGGILSLQDVSFPLVQVNASNFTWAPYSQINILRGGGLLVPNLFELNQRRTISIYGNGTSSEPSLEATTFTVARDSAILVYAENSTISGNFDFFGNLSVYRYLNIEGNLTLEATGTISLQVPLLPSSVPIFVSETASLHGTLHVSLSGYFTVTTDVDVPILTATQLDGDFVAFNGSVADVATSHQLLLSYKLENNTVFLHLSPQFNPSNQNQDSVWWILGSAIVSGILFLLLFACWIRRERRANYAPLT